MPYHQIAQHLPLSTYALLRVLSITPCGLIPRMYLCTAVDSASDMGSDQWVVSVLFDYLFDVSFGFLYTPFGIVLVSWICVIRTINEETWSFPFEP